MRRAIEYLHLMPLISTPNNSLSFVPDQYMKDVENVYARYAIN